ncbi:MAG: hypothetical protein R3Y47_04460 [Lachnospiraceae bacterium]
MMNCLWFLVLLGCCGNNNNCGYNRNRCYPSHTRHCYEDRCLEERRALNACECHNECTESIEEEFSCGCDRKPPCEEPIRERECGCGRRRAPYPTYPILDPCDH